MTVRDIGDWTFDEIVDYAGERLTTRLLKGDFRNLRELAMHGVDMGVRWRAAVDRKEQAAAQAAQEEQRAADSSAAEAKRADGSDLTERGLMLELYVTVDNDGNATTHLRGAPCTDFEKMKVFYQAAVREMNEIIERGPRDCPFKDQREGQA